MIYERLPRIDWIVPRWALVEHELLEDREGQGQGKKRASSRVKSPPRHWFCIFATAPNPVADIHHASAAAWFVVQVQRCLHTNGKLVSLRGRERERERESRSQPFRVGGWMHVHRRSRGGRSFLIFVSRCLFPAADPVPKKKKTLTIRR